MAQGQAGEGTPRREAAGGAAPGRPGAAVSMAAIAMRGIGQYYDMQAAVARMMLQSQARAACAFGLPDYSDLFRIADERSKRLFSEGTEHVLHAATQTSDTVTEVSRQMARLFESQTVHAADNLQRGLDEMEAQTEESLGQLKEFARRQAQELVEATRSLNEAARETLREGGEELRETMRQGLEHGREMVEEESRVARGGAQQAAAAAEEGAEKGRRSRAA